MKDPHRDSLAPEADEVTLLQAALQLAQQRVQRYRNIVAQAPIGIVLIDPQTQRLFNANPAFQHLIGYAAEEVLLLTLGEVLAEPYQNLVHELRHLQQTETVSIREALIRRKNGQSLQVEMSFIFAQVGEEDGFIVTIVRDLTERRKAVEMIRYQANLVQSVSDAIISTDMSFRIESWNRAAEELYGMTAAEVIGQPFGQVLGVEYPGTDRIALLQKLERDGFWSGEQIHRRKDGTPIDILASVAYIWDSNGQRMGIVGVNRDITERKRAERLLLLAQRSEHISLLAGGIAHDFNNLLTGVLAQTSVALRKLSLDDPARTHIEKAIKSAELMAGLTRQLRAYTGLGAFEVEALDLNELVKDNLGLMETFLPKHTRLQLSLISNLATIEIDRGQAQQLIMNLVINAAEAIETEHGRIIIETGETSVAAEQSTGYRGIEAMAPGRYVYLKVIDNGIGMDAATLARIFEPYFTTKKRGSGLGLSATLGIVQKCQGGLKVESMPGVGTTFTLLFPASEAAIPIISVRTPSSATSTSAILVVDDEAPVREGISDILTTEGIKVFLAANGRDGVEKFKRHQSEIDLVLLDMKMPVMNGEETFYALRAIDPGVRIVLSSGYNEPETTNHLLRLGSTQFLSKPYNTQVLLNTVQSAIEL